MFISIKLSSVAFFVVLAISSFTWFVFSSLDLLDSFQNQVPVIEFDMGAMYMLGVGIGLTALVIGGIIQGVLNRELTNRIKSRLQICIFTGIVIMFAFPQLAHFTVTYAVNKYSYHDCGEISYQWLLYKKQVYTESIETCKELVSTNRP